MAGRILLRSLCSFPPESSSSSPFIPARFFPKLKYCSRAFSAAAPAASLHPNRLRNVAVIAHGNAILMDRLLRHCGAETLHDRAVDSSSLERERSITIGSKVTSISQKENELNVVDTNMVDTPVRADFGGEVTSISWKENELNMVDTPGHSDFGGEASFIS